MSKIGKPPSQDPTVKGVVVVHSQIVVELFESRGVCRMVQGY